LLQARFSVVGTETTNETNATTIGRDASKFGDAESAATSKKIKNYSLW
jgi:hypothetical protein